MKKTVKKTIQKEPKVVETLKKQVLELMSELEAEKRNHRYTEGRKDELYEKVQKFEENQRGGYAVMERRVNELSDQIQWMRDLVELIVLPTDKLEELGRLKNEKMRGRY